MHTTTHSRQSHQIERERKSLLPFSSLLQRQKHQQQQQRRREKTKLKFFPNRARATFERETVNRGKRASAQKLVCCCRFHKTKIFFRIGTTGRVAPTQRQNQQSQHSRETVNLKTDIQWMSGTVERHWQTELLLEHTAARVQENKKQENSS